MIISMAKAKKLVSQGNYVLITKDQMKKAVMTENLISGTWVGGDFGPACPVCAVGAVLRSGGLSNSAIRETAWESQLHCDGSVSWESSEPNIKQLLDDGHYLMALSARFETWAHQRKVIDEKLRQDLVIWISKNMPENLLVRRAV